MMRSSFVSMMEWSRPGFWARRSSLALALILFAPFAHADPLPGGLRVTLSAKKIKDGHLAVVRVRIPLAFTMAVEASGTFAESAFPFYQRDTSASRNFYGLFAVPFNTAMGANEVKVSLKIGEEIRELRLPFEVISGRYRSEVLPVDPKFVTLSPEDASRIEGEQKRVAEVYGNSAPRALWGARFQKPVKSRLTSRFGNKRMFNGELQSFHTGADLKALTGTPVRAAAAGKVVLAKDLFFTGNTVILDHGLGLFTVYAHLSTYRVKEGDEVEAGRVLALSGTTGRSSGPHLHWGAVLNRVKFDPLDLLKGVP